MPLARARRLDIAVWLGLILAVFAVYAQAAHHDFVNFDDDLYVYENPQVLAGLSPATLKWALTAVVSSNWMPVTLISHALDVQIFGPAAGPMHLVNAFFHAFAAILLFAALRRATRMPWPSAFVAFVFALHPLHVGSVAWIAERKDVLSAFFWFLALYLYVRYAESPTRGRYAAVAVAFALGLMAKPMLVTFPFTLLLFDVWPLRRFRWPGSVIEKLPLFALSIVASVVSYMVQSSAGAVQSFPLATRVENALVSYVIYIAQTFWPSGLSVFYPWAGQPEPALAGGALLVLIAVTAIAIRYARPLPFLAVGWFWYLGTLVPVIGLVQVGTQAHADRYTYIPIVGLALMLAWGAAELAAKRPAATKPLAIAAVLTCVACLGLSYAEAANWQNNETLYRAAIRNTSNNWLAEYNLGHYLMDQSGRMQEAIPQFEASLRDHPDSADTHNNLGTCYLETGRYAEAATQFQAALKLRPNFANARFNLGLDYMRMQGHSAEALSELEAALRMDPNLVQAQNTLGVLLVQLGRTPEALPHLEAAVRLRPDFSAERNLGAVLATVPGRQADAVTHLENANRLKQDPALEQLIRQLKSR